MYEIFVSIVVGIVQGITEFLPISSTAHNFLVSKLLGRGVDLEVSNIIQFGTLIAIVQYYWSDLSQFGKRIWQVFSQPKEAKLFFKNIKQWWSDNEIDDKSLASLPKNLSTDSTIFQLLIATIPIGLVAVSMRKVIEGLRQPLWIGFFLVLGAVLLGIADWYYVQNKKKKVQLLDKLNVITIGLFQAFAVFPGMSRSGSCLAGSYFIGVKKEVAIRFAFLLSIPALGLAGLADGISFLKTSGSKLTFFPDSSVENFSIFSVLIGTFASYYVGLICLKWLLGFLSKNSFKVFIFYRLILGLILILLSGFAGLK
jgi:undecaprenyl-diphosphatase